MFSGGGGRDNGLICSEYKRKYCLLIKSLFFKEYKFIVKLKVVINRLVVGGS